MYMGVNYSDAMGTMNAGSMVGKVQAVGHFAVVFGAMAAVIASVFLTAPAGIGALIITAHVFEVLAVYGLFVQVVGSVATFGVIVTPCLLVVGRRP